MKLPLSLLLSFITTLLLAQGNTFISPNATYSNADQALFKQYTQAIGNGAAIYNGPEYNGIDPAIAGHPFFLTRNYQFGSATYLGYRYDSLVIAYDIASDQLVLAYPKEKGFFAILPVKSRVSQFELNGHTFVNIEDPKAYNGITESGYYDVLYDGRFKMLARRKKLVLPYREGDYLYRYETNDSYYVWHNNKFKPVRSKSSFLQLFKEQKRDIKQFLRDNRLDFKSNPDNFLRKLGTFLDENIVP